jgi:hypothetical protein
LSTGLHIKPSSSRTSLELYAEMLTKVRFILDRDTIVRTTKVLRLVNGIDDPRPLAQFTTMVHQNCTFPLKDKETEQLKAISRLILDKQPSEEAYKKPRRLQ